jgi:hypothetical protein
VDPADAVNRAQELVDALHHGTPGVDALTAQAELDRLTAAVGTTEPAATVMELMNVLVTHVVTQQQRDLVGMDRVADRATKLRSRLPSGSVPDLIAQVIAACQRAVAANARGDDVTVNEQIDTVTSLRGILPAGDPGSDQVRSLIDEMIASILPYRDITAGVPGPAVAGPDRWQAQLDPLRRAAERPGQSTADRAMALAYLAGAEMAAAEAGAPGPYLDDAARHFREAAEVGGEHDPRRVTYLTGYGGSLVRRFETRRSGPDLDTAFTVLDEARRLAVDPADPHWALLCQMLSMAHRLAGRSNRADEIGRDGLRGHAWSVLLQADAAAATAVARNAAFDAVHQARWCLGFGDTEGGIAALDSGRGLTLQAATRFDSAVERLRADGANELAARWEDAVRRFGAQDAPIHLRREVVRRLDGSGSGTRWWSAPDAARIRAALLRLDLDALVYLVAGDGGQEQGFMVVVPARGEPTLLMLPRLSVEPSGLLDRYLAASAGHAARGLGQARGGGGDRSGGGDCDDDAWAESLHQVCGWAWTAAIGPLLDDHLPQRHRFTRGRTPRLVLVPMGELAVVPWHAARSDRPTGPQYAVERAVFSMAVSAGMLCDTADADAVQVTPSGLVIGDPDTGGTASQLPAALREALAIKEVFYPRARYLGRTSDRVPVPGRTGSRAEVQGWLADRGVYAGTVLHAACHGVVRSGTGRDDSSYLLLAGGEHLAAEDVIRTLATDRPSGLALAVLAACHSGVPGRGYDESFSLATAFLAGGTRTVVSAQWALPDSATSALMFMFHHHLRGCGLPPVDALRAAQLWMLRRDRVVPDTMPRQLRRIVQRGNPADVVAWAGFSHTGR